MSALTLTTIQANLHWEDKEANLQMLEKRIDAIQEKTELIILPEMFNTGFSMQPKKLAETMDGPTVSWMKRMSQKKKAIITGSLIISDEREQQIQYYNRLLWVLPNGQLGYYDKRHLFAYGGEDKEFSPGKKRLLASVNGWKVNLLICYDLRFPVWARQQSQEGEAEYDLLIYVANWPDRRNQAWKTLLRARAIENQSFVVGVNRVGKDGLDNNHTGDSMVIDPMGEILYHKADEEDVFTITLQKQTVQNTREKLPFLKDADGFMIYND